jgi:hypothetical protein
MRKVTLAAALVALFMTFAAAFPAPAKAFNILSQSCRQNPTATVCKDQSSSGANPIYGPSGLLTRITVIFSEVVAIVAVIFIVLAGIKFVTSQGDPQGVASAKRQVIYAVVGILVAAFAQLIVGFVLTKVK